MPLLKVVLAYTEQIEEIETEMHEKYDEDAFALPFQGV
jgi:hypothetical protein